MEVGEGCLCRCGEGPFEQGMALQPCVARGLTLRSPSHLPYKLFTTLHPQREASLPPLDIFAFLVHFSTTVSPDPKHTRTDQMSSLGQPWPMELN